ncbi:MAG: glycosyltransferase family 2 protein [Lentisphaeria bacterium]|nr:glycosyltransferase family 2 protein [Lentisphaeria bacterium]
MKKLSVLIPCYNEQEVFPFLRQELECFCSGLSEQELDYEIILVDDGSHDLTWPLILDWSSANPHVRGLSLSRNFGHQAALSCACQVCTGDVSVSLDADLQDPPEVIMEMLEKWRAGADIVYGIRSRREAESFFKKVTAAGYYRFLQYLGVKLERDCGDFRLMNRRSMDALNAMPERGRLLRAMVGWIGFRTERVYFVRHARKAGETKYPLRKMIALAADGIFSFSYMPLRISYYLSLLLALPVLIYLAATLILYSLGKATLVPGWTSIVLIVTLFGAGNLICLGAQGEYIRRIYSEVKQRPLYWVREDTAERKAEKR